MSRVFYQIIPLKQDGENNCWYWAAKMIIDFHHGPGYMRSFKEIDDERNKRNIGGFETLSIYEGIHQDIKPFWDIVGLKPCPVQGETLTKEYLYSCLSKYGPLWAGGSFGIRNNAGHIIVVTGMGPSGNTDVVDYNDPGFGAASQMTFNQFLDKLLKYGNETALAYYAP